MILRQQYCYVPDPGPDNFPNPDFFRSLLNSINDNTKSPLYPGSKWFAAISLESNGNTSQVELTQSVLSQIEGTWNTFAQSRPFEYQFVADAFAATFEGEAQFAQLLTIFAGLAIVIACLGLFGIIIYTIEQRTKEIGIRKVVGAGIWHIAVLLSKDHTKLILASILVGIPVAVVLMQNWLDDFLYRVTMSPYIFVGTGLSVIALALMISGYHTIRAAKSNPVDVIKDE